MEKRTTVIVSGDVQLKGFRYIVKRIAISLRLKGTVENLPDGTVQIVCEGEEEKIKELTRRIRDKKYFVGVEKVDLKFEPTKREFTEFKMIRGDLQEEIAERMDVAAGYLMSLSHQQDKMLGKQDQMLGKQDTTIDKQDKMLEKQDKTIEAINGVSKKQEKTLTSIEKMNADMNKRFEEMERKYHIISKALVIGIAQLQKQSAKSDKIAKEHTKAVNTLVALVKHKLK